MSTQITELIEHAEAPIACKLCNKIFVKPLGVVLSETPDQRAQAFVARLMVHLNERHKEYAAACGVAGREYIGMLTLLYFKMEGDIERQRDFLRWKIHRATTRAAVSDDRIRERVIQLLAGRMTEPEIAHVMQPGGLGGDIMIMMQQLRNVLSEHNRYDERGNLTT